MCSMTRQFSNCVQLSRKNSFLKMPYPSQIGKNIQDLPTPCLIVSAKAVEDNCNKMLEKAQKLGVQLRGQTKTHKTIEAGVLQTGGTKR